MDATFTNEITVNLPRDQTAALYSNVDYLKLWQPNFVSHKLLSDPSKGELEVAEVTYRFGENEITFVRRVLKQDLPKMVVSTFEIDGLRQIVEIRFAILSDNQCILTSEVTYSSTSQRFLDDPEGFSAGLKAQSIRMQNLFKTFAENFEN